MAYDPFKDCKMDKIVLYTKHLDDKIPMRDILEIIVDSEINSHVSVSAFHVESTSIGPWEDGHELNQFKATQDQYEKYFEKKEPADPMADLMDKVRYLFTKHLSVTPVVETENFWVTAKTPNGVMYVMDAARLHTLIQEGKSSEEILGLFMVYDISGED